MSQRFVSIALFAAVASGAALVLSGCFLIPSQPEPDPSGPFAAPTDTPAPSTSVTPTPIPTATATTPPTAAGCAANSAQMPAGAVAHKTIDIDGDGLTDTEWVSDSPSLQFGVTTASGATFSYPLATASPAAREGFIARLNDHRIVSIVDDGRAAYVHFFVSCAWVTTKHPNGSQYILDFNDVSGTGSGVGCILGYVNSYNVKNTATGDTVTATPLNLNGTGSIANPGAVTTVVANASASDPRVKVAQEISCGSVTVASGGVSLH
ncbi:MAG TPA: hypothetical protein VHZ81_15065 [Galbitalea sp.]|jgi:hypothetical protein|nr:hypothetical protein [Galbitalea sp.]